MGNVHDLGDYRNKASGGTSAGGLKGGGGGGTFDDMEARVSRLEKVFEKIEAKLDRISSDVSEMKATLPSLAKGSEVSEIKGALPGLAKAADVSAVAASLKDKPSTWQAVIISLAISGLTVAAALGGAARLLGK